jgi:outer membrane murein-binding lipoprotein Lpp
LLTVKIFFMKGTKILLALIIAGTATLAACGSGNNSNNDSTSVSTMDTSAAMPDTSLSDTVPAAEMPAGAINPGEDSARYGTGTNDTSKKRRP